MKINNMIKKLVLLLNDFLLLFFSTWAALVLRYEDFFILSIKQINYFLYSFILLIVLFYFFKIYNSVTRYFGINNLINLTYAVAAYGFILSIYTIIARPEDIPRSVGGIQTIIFYATILVNRLTIATLIKKFLLVEDVSPVIIYGAGKYGVQVNDMIAQSNEYKVKAFVDDNKHKIGREINGIKIYEFDHIKKLINKENIKNLILAIRTISPDEKRLILSKLKQFNLEVMVMPSLSNFLKYGKKETRFKKINVIDILNRNIHLNEESISKKFKAKTVVVTGAGGSIGGELCQQIILYKPSTIYLIENNEYNLYNINRKLNEIIERNNFHTKVVGSLCSINDFDRLSNFFKKIKPNYVFHTAAYKHVPLVESNIIDGVRNNIFGTINVMNAAVLSSAENFVLVSTDKAVRPTNVMGATKRFAEICIQRKAQESGKQIPIFSIVRFGNVLNSSGSVVPLFKEQIDSGGPVTVTDPNVTRFFMTISEAVGLILQSTTFAVGGEVFVFKMGEPHKIADLAEKMIELSGSKVKNKKTDDGIEIKFTGLRPGEKMFEELLIDGNFTKTNHDDIVIANEKVNNLSDLDFVLNQLSNAVQTENSDKIISIFENNIEGFNDRISAKD